TFSAPVVSESRILTFSLMVKDVKDAPTADADSVNILIKNIDDSSHNNSNDESTNLNELVTYVKDMHLTKSMEKVLIGSSYLKYGKGHSDDNYNKNSHDNKAFCGKLGAFENKINAMEKSRRRTLNQSEDLTHLTQEIKSSLKC